MSQTHDEAVFVAVFGYLPGLHQADFVYATGHEVKLPPVPLIYGVIATGTRVVLFDAGASPDWAFRKGVLGYRSTDQVLRPLGLSRGDVTDVVLSHLHWDHATEAPAFDRARFWLQRSELDGWARALAASADLRWVHEGRVDQALLDALQATGRVELVEGDREIVDGISIHLAPGHTFGTQMMTIHPADRPIVFASDVVFTYENVERMIPLGNGLDQVAMLRSIARARDLAQGGLLVPGHDSRLLEALEPFGPGIFRVR